MKTHNVYFGCALKASSEEYKQFVTEVKARLRSELGLNIMEFLVGPGTTPEMVFQNDIIGCVAKCDFMIADFTHPSTGLGYEVATVIEKYGKQVIGLAQRREDVSRLILGISHPQFSFDTYATVDDVVKVVRGRMAKIL